MKGNPSTETLEHIPRHHDSVGSPVELKSDDDWRLVEWEKAEEAADFTAENEAWFERLEKLLQDPTFAERLQEYHQRRRLGSKDSVEDSNPPGDDSSVDEASSDGSFVIVNKEDALEEMVDMITSCVMSCPEAQELQPKELQAAIVNACKELKKSRARSAWGWCKFIYRTASWTYTAFNLYANPWIIRAIVMAFWTVPSFFGPLFGRFFF